MDRSTFSSLTAGDAAVALRSLARRFRECFRPGELRGAPDAVDVAQPPPDGGPAPLDLVLAARAALTALARATQSTLDNDQPRLDRAVLDRSTRDTPVARQPIGEALDGLTDAAETFADRVGRTPLEDWKRSAEVDGVRIEAIELVREAVASARTYLDQLSAALDQLRRAAR